MSAYAINLTSILAASAVILGYVIYMILKARHKIDDAKARWNERIDKMSGSPLAVEEEDGVGQVDGNPLIKTKTGTESYFSSKIPKIEGFKEWILHAGIEVNIFVFMGVSFIVGVFFGLGFFMFFHAGTTLSILFGVLGMFLLPWLFIGYLTRRRKNLFLQDFTQALDMIRRALQAGHSVDRALVMVVDHMGGPVGDAFKRVTEKMRLGETVENVLGEVANRVGVDDFRMLAIVIVLQRETGGSLAEAMENFAKVIRARQNLRKKIKSLTAEGRMTAIILISIPFFVLGAIYFTTPTFLNPLFNTAKGQNLLIIAGVMMGSGITMILRMVYKEVY